METGSARARLDASLLDLTVIGAWLATLTAAGVLARRHTHPEQQSLLATDLVAAVATVLPTAVYLTAGEAGHRQAAWGKRRAGLRVVKPDGGRAGPGRVLLRTAVKLLPWQLAHVAVVRLIRGVDAPATIWATDGLSLLLAAASVTLAARDRQSRALHDRVAGTRVVTS